MGFKYVIVGAIGLVYELRSALAKALAVPFIFHVFLDFVESIKSESLLAYGIVFLVALVQTIFAITTHRVILLGPKSVPKWGLMRWTKRETYFFLHLFGLGLLFLPIIVFTFIPFVGGILGLIICCWLIGRLSLVFPAIATDQGLSFKDSWNMTANHQGLMFLVVIVYPILLTIPIMVAAFLPGTLLLESIMSTLATVFVVSALSVSYKVIYAQEHEN